MEISAQDSFEILFYENLARRNREDATALELLAGLYCKYGMARQALRIDRRIARLIPDDARAQYNLACSLALLNRKKEAVERLSRALELGYDDWKWMQKDPDLKTLDRYPPYLELIEKRPLAAQEAKEA